MSGSLQAETSTSDHRQGRRRRHRSRHDEAVAHLAQLPAAAPRCRDLSDSSLADRAGQEPSRCRRREGHGLSAGPGPFMLGLIIPPPSPPLPPSPTFPTPPTHPSPHPHPLHTHLHQDTHHTPYLPTHEHTQARARLHARRGRARLDPVPCATSRTVDQTPPQ